MFCSYLMSGADWQQRSRGYSKLFLIKVGAGHLVRALLAGQVCNGSSQPRMCECFMNSHALLLVTAQQPLYKFQSLWRHDSEWAYIIADGLMLSRRCHVLQACNSRDIAALPKGVPQGEEPAPKGSEDTQIGSSWCSENRAFQLQTRDTQLCERQRSC